MSTVFIGIDPGVTGAIAFIDRGKVYTHLTKQLTESDRLEVLRDILDDDGRTAYLDGQGNLHPTAHCWIEEVNAMSPGRKACFELGGSYYGWRMAAMAANIGFQTVRPLRWQQIIGFPRKKLTYAERKKRHKAMAQQLYPHLGKWITNGNADAILIATACQKAMGNDG